ncbi:MAG TPA: PKD domain-containing protein, partial [Gemmatimonadales bacterium]|nr:PKD domain-containing protein [Gemmatimonadales bacterium]
MLPRFSRFLTLGTAATLTLWACTRETPVQPPRANVIAQGPGGTPSNDFRDSARFIASLPYLDTTDVTNATIEAGEPSSICHDTVGLPTRTVWYYYQSGVPGTAQLTAFLQGPAPGVLSVYVASGDSLIPSGCDANNFGLVRFNADSGEAFFFQVSDSAGATGPTVFRLQQDTVISPPPPPPPPPAGNDNFADARADTVVPYSDTADFTNATREPGEPTGCYFQSRTLWYAFRSSTTRPVFIGVQSGFFHGINVFTGSSLGNLQFTTCGAGSFSFTAVAGVTYYIQVNGDFSDRAIFFINPPPPPQANFYNYPSDPSTYDVVQFYDGSYDPGGIGIQTWQWSFGDGATATGSAPTHRYAADGDYQVHLTVTTYDGRSGSIARVIPVRTHDVAITKLTVPNAASSGQTRSISVGVVSNRYPEIVTVSLYKSVPGGYQQIGALQQSV